MAYSGIPDTCGSVPQYELLAAELPTLGAGHDCFYGCLVLVFAALSQRIHMRTLV